MSDFWHKDFCRAVEFASNLSRWKFWGTFFVKKRHNFLMLFRLWARTFPTSGEEFRQVSQICILRPMNVLWKKISRKKKIFLSFPKFVRKHVQLLAQRLLQSCRNCFFQVQINVLRNFFWKIIEFFYAFQTLSKKHSDFWQKTFLQSCKNCILRVQVNASRNIFFGKKV